MRSIRPATRSEAKRFISDVFERQVEARRARVALAAGAAAQLVVDAPRLVALGADDVQAAGGDNLVVIDVDFGLGLGERLVELLLGRLGRVDALAVHLGRGHALRDCRRAGCPCRGRPCSWRS